MSKNFTFSEAGNPIFPATAFVPDGEPHVFEYKDELRVFVYGSRDEVITGYCGYGHDTWSSPIDDLSQWTNHGEIFNIKQVWDIGYGIVQGQVFGAPDCVYSPVTKKYYLYTFLGTEYFMDGIQGPLPGSDNYIPGFENLGPKCVMAISDSPAGPFINPVICDWPAANRAGTFDPSVLVDEQEDGSIKVYAYWGMYNCDIKGDRWAQIDPGDMHTIIDCKTGKPDKNAWYRTLGDDLSDNETILFEASSIKKISAGKYVFIYSAIEHYTALTYCYSSSPEGPWKYGGKIVDNNNYWRGGNNHGSIAKINDRWYVFYHRATCDDFNRQAMIEPIEIFIEGDKVIIPEVEMTSQGVNSEGMYAFQRFNANSASYLTKNAHIKGSERNSDGLDPICGIDLNNTIVGYKYLNFGEKEINDSDGCKLKLNIAMFRNTSIDIQVENPDVTLNLPEKVTIFDFDLQDYVDADGKYHEIIVSIEGLDGNTQLKNTGGLKGKHAIFFAFSGNENDEEGELCRFKEFELSRGDALTPNPLREIIFESGDYNGKVEALPSKGRGGESIKLSVFPKEGYKLKSIDAIDELGNILRLNRNCDAPYAPASFNFNMPAAGIRVFTRFELCK